MWNFHSWTLDASSNVKLPIWPVDISSNVKLPFLTTRCQWHVKASVKGVYIWHECTILTDCLLPELFRSKRRLLPFLEESKMAAKYISLYLSPEVFWGVEVDLLTYLSRSVLTTILHIKTGKYDPLWLKFVIVMCGGCFGQVGVVEGSYIWHDCTMLTDCLPP